MNTIPRFWTLAGLFFAANLATFAELTPAAGTEPKTHTLYMGADISVEYNNVMHRVQSVVDGAMVINVSGKEVRITSDWSKVNLKVDRTLKLTGRSASVINLKGERAYSPGNDPWENYQKGLVKAEVFHGESAAASRMAADARYAVEFEHVSQDPMGAGAAAHSANLSKAVSRQNAVNSSVMAGAESLERMGLEIEGQESFDAMRITFEVSSEQPLTNAYVVVLGQFHDKTDKPGTVANWFYAQPLSTINQDGRKITLLKTGFPPGFEALPFQVHLYNQGKEIATSVAPKRVSLTKEEAFTYANIEYLSANKKTSGPAKPCLGKLSPEAKSQITPEQYGQPYYVKVTKEGLPIAGYLDTNCSRKADDVINALIAQVRFYPALEKGKAVEGVAELKFPQLAL